MRWILWNQKYLAHLFMNFRSMHRYFGRKYFYSYRFLQVLKEYPELDSTRIWNCDESGFPTDPSKGKVINKKVCRTIFNLFWLIQTSKMERFAKKLPAWNWLTFSANPSHLTLNLGCLTCPQNTCRFNNKYLLPESYLESHRLLKIECFYKHMYQL